MAPGAGRPTVAGVFKRIVVGYAGDQAGRDAAVLAYQTGGGLAELVTPTNGALMAVLLAAGVPYQRWLGFVVWGVAVLALVGVLAIAVAI